MCSSDLDASGQGGVYGPGDSIVAPRGWSGTWKQASPITKFAVSYQSSESAVDLSGGASAGQTWFNQHVAPKLVGNGCHACHATGYVLPNVLVYEQLLPYLGMGWTRDDNVLIYKLANLRSIAPDRDTHVGGRRCATPDAEPCATLKAWWDREFGAGMEQPQHVE